MQRMEDKAIEKQKQIKMARKYEQLRNKQLSLMEALKQIFEGQKTIKDIKLGLASLGEQKQQVMCMNWRDKEVQAQFIELCVKLDDYFQNEKEKAMRRTEKSLNEVNEEILKMRKSLTSNGILPNFPIEANQKDNLLSQQNRGEENSVLHNESDYVGEKQYQNQGQKQENDFLKEYDAEPNNNQIRDRKQVSEAYVNDEEQQHKDGIRNKSRSSQGNENEQWSWGRDEINNEAQQLPNFHRQIEMEIEYSKNKLQSNKQLKQMEKKLNGAAKIDQQELAFLPKEKYSEANRDEQNYIHSSLQETQIHSQQKIPIPFTKNKLSLQQFQRRQQEFKNKLKTKEPQPQHETSNSIASGLANNTEQNESHHEILANSSKQKRRKVPKYNPHLQIKKKLGKNKKQSANEPKNQIQSEYLEFKEKLRDLFPFYLKELKTSSFTFDAYPQSLDLKTFSSYCTHFKLNELIKATEMVKHFKKYAQNGAWLNEQGFVKLNLKIADLPQDMDQQIKEVVEQIGFCMSKHEAEEFNIDDSSEKSLKLVKKLSNDRELVGRILGVKEKYKDIMNKLNKINSMLPRQQIKRLLRKIEKKSVHIDRNYDPEKLRKIVEAHSGIYKQDIIEKLKERKREKEKRQEQKIHQVLQKYKIKPQIEANVQSKSSFKSNQSSPNLQKIQGYANINKMKKHSHKGLSNQQNMKDLPTKSQSKQRLKSQSKNKSFLTSKQLNQENKELDSPSYPTKTELYRQLSLPKLPKRKMRQKSIYEELKLIDSKAELQSIKNLLKEEKQAGSKQQEKIFNEFFAKEKLISEKERNKKSQVLERMKFT